MRLERAEIERQVGQARRQDAARGAAREIALERMALRHAAAIFVDQLAHGDAGRRELDARLLDAARDREAARPLAAAAALAREPVRALLDDVAHPVERLDVVDEGRPAEEPDLRRDRAACGAAGRACPRCFRASPIPRRRYRRRRRAADGSCVLAREPRRFERGDLPLEQHAALRVFVAQIDIDVARLDRPGADQHAFEEAVRIGLEEIAVLEGAGLALVGIDRHQPRLPARRARAPICARWESRRRRARAAPNPRAASARPRACAAGEARLQQLVAAVARDSRRARDRPGSTDGFRRAATAAATLSTVACSCSAWPMAATGALWQPPMQGARTTRTPGPSRAGSSASSCCAPDSAQVRLSQTRTVSGGGAGSPSMTMSKCA